MNIKGYIIIIIAVIISAGCNRKAVQEYSTATFTGAYDTTMYNLNFTEGIKQKMLGNAGDAMRYLEQAIKINPNSDAAYFEISQISAAMGDIGNAKKYAIRAVNADSLNIWYLNNAANIFYSAHNIDSAAIYFREMVRLDPKRVDVKFNLGSLYMESGQLTKAEKIFQEFYDEYGADEQIVLALLSVKRALGKNDEVIELLKQLALSDPDNVNYSGMLAEIYRELGNPDEAKNIYDTLFLKEPENQVLLFSYIEYLLEEKKFSEALGKIMEVVESDSVQKDDKINLLARVVESDSTGIIDFETFDTAFIKLCDKYPDDITAILLRAEFYNESGKDTEEIDLLEKTIKKNPDIYFVWEKLLLKYNETGNTDMLFLRSKEAATKFNMYPLPKMLYAFTASRKGEYDTALAELNKVKILTNNDPAYAAQIISMEGEILYDKGEYKAAFEKLDSAVEATPDDPVLLNNYAYYIAEHGTDIAKARKMIEKCLSIEKNSTYLDTYAWVLYKDHKYKDAERIMEEIASGEPLTDPEYIEHYGYIKAARKECDIAVKLWKEALKMDPSKEYLNSEIEKCLKGK